MVITKQSSYYDEGIASFNEGKLELGRAWRGKLAKKKWGGGGGGGGGGGLRSTTTFSAANEIIKRY